jgi:hypothetical protein
MEEVWFLRASEILSARTVAEDGLELGEREYEKELPRTQRESRG